MTDRILYTDGYSLGYKVWERDGTTCLECFAALAYQGVDTHMVKPATHEFVLHSMKFDIDKLIKQAKFMGVTMDELHKLLDEVGNNG